LDHSLRTWLGIQLRFDALLVFAFARAGQGSDQQLKDESECYGAARQHSGIDPKAPAAPTKTEEQKKAEQKEAAEDAPQAQGKTLFTFVAYHAGPARVRKLQRMATEQGLDPNIRFGNVELMAAKDIGPETVQYVGNIYKYYVAYKMSLEQQDLRKKAMESSVRK
jgi:hypothetical protein